MSIKDKLFAALEKIGKSNGHSTPSSQDPADSAMHEYFVASLGESYFKKRRENAKKGLDKLIGPEAAERLAKAILGVKKSELGTSIGVLDGEHYGFTIELKNGASFLDTKALKVELMKRMTSIEVDTIFDRCSDRREPAQSWKVEERS